MLNKTPKSQRKVHLQHVSLSPDVDSTMELLQSATGGAVVSRESASPSVLSLC